MRLHRSAVLVLLAVGAMALGACSSSVDSGGPANSTAPVPSAAASSDAGAEAGPATAVESDLALLSKVLVRSLNPEPTFELTGESVEFAFPSGSHTDGGALSNCQIALGALGMDSDVTMTYPDGSVRCADLLS